MEKMNYDQAYELMKTGKSIALPEWGGFWFMDIKKEEVFVLTRVGDITPTPHEKYKIRTDWMVVSGTPEQNKQVSEFLAARNSEPKLWFQGEERELTFGEKAVGVSFNPSKMPEVDSIKANFAQLIDLMEDNKFNTRLGAMLKTEAQMNCVRASMSIVKLLTFTE